MTGQVRLLRPWFLPEGRVLPDVVWRQRHRSLTWLLWGHLPALMLFAFVRHLAPAPAAMQIGVLLLPASLASLPRLSRQIRSASTSIGLVVGASILVQLSGGAIEAHFQFFVVLAFLTLYQSWLPYLLALLYVVIEHGLVGALDAAAVYNHPVGAAHPWRYALIHGGFVLAASFANLISWRLTEQESLQDGLTGLPNRVALLEGLERNLQGRGRTTTHVLFIDLDNFKDANDAFGHQVGDELLIALALRLRQNLRAGDLLARLGGDEFAIVLQDTPDRDDALEASQRILDALHEDVQLAGITLVVEASMGLAHADGETSSADLLRNADLAMYDAKREGGGRVVTFRPVLHMAAVSRTELESDLRVALERGQFEVHYQPIYALTTQEIVGTEALVRWQHPVRGLVPPSDFIPAAEQSGLIIALGAWVLRTACAQTAAWQRQHPDRAPLTVAVNLSPRQLTDRRLVDTVAKALADTGLPASSLCLEITEGSVIKDFEASQLVLDALRKLGVSLALDDFGTGYSSLSYLTQLPVNSVKIDRSFVTDLGVVSANSKIVTAIVELAHALGMSVTAEGAETQLQLQALRSIGSDHVQGFLLGRPAPAAVVAEALRLPTPRRMLCVAPREHSAQVG
jgi:diguanylate cyclase (GGDEF)-like protein